MYSGDNPFLYGSLVFFSKSRMARSISSSLNPYFLACSATAARRRCTVILLLADTFQLIVSRMLAVVVATARWFSKRSRLYFHPVRCPQRSRVCSQVARPQDALFREEQSLAHPSDDPPA